MNVVRFQMLGRMASLHPLGGKIVLACAHRGKDGKPDLSRPVTFTLDANAGVLSGDNGFERTAPGNSLPGEWAKSVMTSLRQSNVHIDGKTGPQLVILGDDVAPKKKSAVGRAEDK